MPIDKTKQASFVPKLYPGALGSLVSIWRAMWNRCYNSKDPAYKSYGGRGIAVCDRWRWFDNFLADMGPRPDPTLSLDRIDNNGDYEPGNCRWATRAIQANNTRNTLLSAQDIAKVKDLYIRGETVENLVLRFDNKSEAIYHAIKDLHRTTFNGKIAREVLHATRHTPVVEHVPIITHAPAIKPVFISNMDMIRREHAAKMDRRLAKLRAKRLRLSYHT